MPSFTEYVKLIAEGNEAIAVINKINEAIAKMRREASQPINVKIKSDIEAQVAGERRIRAEKKKTVDQEEAAIQKLKAERSAIKRMNEEQGNAPHNIRLGSPQSIAQAQRFNEQLEESTKRINRLADAHKHIKQTAKAADVEVSHSLSEKLAAQTVGRTEKSDAQAIKDAAAAQAKAAKDVADKRKEFERQMSQGIARSEQIQKKADAAAIAAENERLRLSKKRFEEEMKAERIIGQMEKERIRAEEAEKRKQAQMVRETERAEHRARRERETQIASIRESGIRGVVGEFHRDIRRNMIYGGIAQAEHIVGAGFHSGLDRSKEVEAQYQSGRTPEERKMIERNAEEMSRRYAMMSKTEGMALQRHAIGEVGDISGGIGLAKLATPFMALRTSAIGAEQALDENQKIMKGFNELGWVKKPELMKAAYESLAKMSQVEGKNFDPESWLQIIRMAKSAKFAMTPEAMMNLAPLISIGEGAGRTGNEFAMLFKTLSFTGKSLDNSVGKTNHQQFINGTVLSDNKGGFNPELARAVASGTVEGVHKFNEMLDEAAKKKGVNPENALDFKQWLAHVFANQSAQELAMWFHEKEDFIVKQRGMYGKALGTEAAEGIQNRDMNSALEGAKAKFTDAASAVIDPFKNVMLGIINKATQLEQFAANHPKSTLATTGALGAAGVLALMKSAWENPAQAANTAALVANTGAVTLNTGSRALGGGVPGGPGKLFGANPFLVGAAIGTAFQMGIIQPWIDDKKNKAQEGLVDKYRNDLQLREKVITQVPNLITHGDFNHGDPDDPRPTLDKLQNELRIALEAQRRNDRDMAELMAKHRAEEREKYYPSVDSYHDRHPFITTPMPTKEEEHPYKQSWTAPWRLGDSTQQGGVFNSGGIMNNGKGTAREQPIPVNIDESSAQAAIAKISEAGGGAASALESVGGALKEGAGVAASAISGAGSAVVNALADIAAKISGVRIQGPATAGQAQTPAGTRERGNR